jgi:hypothetical protein
LKRLFDVNDLGHRPQDVNANTNIGITPLMTMAVAERHAEEVPLLVNWLPWSRC